MRFILSSLIALTILPLAAVEKPVTINGNDLVISGDLGLFVPTWELSRPEPDLLLATLNLESPQASTPPAIQVAWKFPAVDLSGVWGPDQSIASYDHQSIRIDSRAVLHAPLIMFLNPSDQNRLTFSVSDAMRPISIRAGVQEEDVNIHGTVKLFANKEVPLKTYQITLRFDSRPLAFQTVLRDTARWWAAQDGYQPASVPDAARVPMYSTWYSYHQNIDADQIVAECQLGGKIGLGGVIVDDGWQTLDSNRGYAFTGDWKPKRIPNFKGLVDRIHELHQTFMLWYSVPMVGENSQAARQFKGKMLGFSKGLKAYILDPRYPEVREHLIGVYEKAVREWGIDGLKLDFIEMFAPKADTVLTADDGRDFASVDKAVDRLFTDIMTRLRAIKPNITIEFRQPYNGPLMRKYGNMLRGVDCPNAGPVNRKETVDLRLLADHTAVHSDMIVWHPAEPVESAALQILNVLFSVPQLSVRLAEISPEHRQMIGFWMGYWRENRSILLDGEFQPVSPAQNYPAVMASTPEKLIAAIYQEIVVSPGKQAPAQIDVVNAKPGTAVVLRFDELYGSTTIRTRDCLGAEISSQTQVLSAGAHSFEVPPSGLLEIRRK